MAGNNWSGCPLRRSRGIVIRDLVSDIIVSQRISAWLGQLRFPSWLTVQGSLIENLVAEVFYLFIYFKSRCALNPHAHSSPGVCRMPSHPRPFLLALSHDVRRQRRCTASWFVFVYLFVYFLIHHYPPLSLAHLNRITCLERSGASRTS